MPVEPYAQQAQARAARLRAELAAFDAPEDVAHALNRAGYVEQRRDAVRALVAASTLDGAAVLIRLRSVPRRGLS